MPIDYTRQIQDLQTALRTLWPDRAKVYFTEAAAAADGNQGVVLTEEEQNLLNRVAHALAAVRDNDAQVSRTVATIEEDAVYDFLQWMTLEGIDLVQQVSTPDTASLTTLQPGNVLGRWKAERHG